MVAIRKVRPARIARRAQRGARRFLPRRTHVYGVGLGKTGTSSLAQMFLPRFRSRHEAEAPRMVPVSTRYVQGGIDPSTVRSELLRRDRRLCLEVDVAAFLSPLTGELAELFPDARFIVTIRNCFSWLESMLEHMLRYPLPPSDRKHRHWRAWRDERFPRIADAYAPEDEHLHELDLPPVRVALDHWARVNTEVLAAIPPDLSLVVRTEDLDASHEAIAKLCGIDAGGLRRVHANSAPRRHGALDTIRPDFLVDAAEARCAPIMQAYWGSNWRERPLHARHG